MDILEQHTLHQGRVFRLERFHVRLPDGRETDYDLVSHPGAVTILPVDEKGNILFVWQYRLGARQDLLELPAGTLEPGEPAEECAAREIREETGMAAKKMVKLGTFFLAPGYSSEFMHIFMATDLFTSPLEGDEDEFLRVEKIPVKQAYQMVNAGGIQDGKSLAALLLALPLLKKSAGL